MSLRGQVASGVRWTGLATTATAVLQAVQLIVLARLLEPTDLGLMGMVVVAIGFAQAFSDMGLSAALIHRQDASPRQLSSLYWFSLGAGVVAYGLFLAVIPLVVRLFGEPELRPLLAVAGAVLVVVPVGKQFELLMQRDLRFAVLGKLEVAAIVIGFLVTVAAAMGGLGVWSLVGGALAAATSRTTLLLWRGWPVYRPAAQFRWSDLRGFLSFGAYQMGERSLNYIGQRLDQLLLGALLGAARLGYYNFALNLAAQPLARVNPMVTRVTFPVFARVQHDTERLRRGYLGAVALITAVNAPLLLGMAAVAPAALPLIFGPKWQPSIVLVQLLALVTLLRSTGNPIGGLLLAKGRADLGLWWNALLLVLSVPMLYVGAVHGGAIGVCLGLLALQVLVSVLAYPMLIRPIVGPAARAYAAAILRPAVLAIVMAFVVAGVPRIVPVDSLAVVLVLQVLVGVAVYVVLLRGFAADLLSQLGAVVRRRAPTLAVVDPATDPAPPPSPTHA